MGSEFANDNPVTSGGHRELSEEEERVIRDTPEHRFDRLLRVLEQSPAEWNYEQVGDLESAFDHLVTGTMVSIDCDIEVPPVSSMLAQPDQLTGLLDAMETFASVAPVFGQAPEGMPSSDQIKAMRAFSKVKADLIIVGEVDDGAPKVAGKLEHGFVREIPSGEATIVGKVARRWKDGEHYSLIALPGAALMSRSQRRKTAKPPAQDDDNVLHGPALTLDVLAIYR